jgi:hypothetical protein
MLFKPAGKRIKRVLSSPTVFGRRVVGLMLNPNLAVPAAVLWSCVACRDRSVPPEFHVVVGVVEKRLGHDDEERFRSSSMNYCLQHTE